MYRLSFILVLIGINYFAEIQCYKNYDNYVLESYNDCTTNKRIYSCSRYRLAKYLWTLNLKHVGSNYDIVSLNLTQDDADLFPEARYSTGTLNKLFVVTGIIHPWHRDS